MEEVVVSYKDYTLVVSAGWWRIQLLPKHLCAKACTAKKAPLLRIKGPASAALRAMVRPLRDFIALKWYLQQSSLWIPWGFGALVCFACCLVIIQTLESFRLLEHIWNSFSLGLAVFYPKHSEMKIFVVVWDNIHISLWLLPSCEQLAANTACLHRGCWLCEPHDPCAAEKTSRPALVSTRLAASACLCQGSRVSSSLWCLSVKNRTFYSFTFPIKAAYTEKQHIETVTWNAWCEPSLESGCSWVVVVAQLQGPEKAIQKRGQTQSHSSWEEWSPGTSIVKVFCSQQNDM